MHPHETLLRRLFDRLAARDAEGADSCYHAEVFLTNPLFARLRGADALRLWRLVFEEASDWRLEARAISADEDGGRAEWSATYTLGGRRFATEGRSLFAFREGLVCRHYDAFSLWRWIAQAIGPMGVALGWFGPVRWAVRQRLARRLERA
jgi:hypothetical protein